MGKSIALPAAMIEIWSRQSPRDRLLLTGLGVFLLAVLAFSLVWQPAQQRLLVAERQYQQRLALAMEVQRAQPPNGRAATTQPPSTQVSESAVAAGLELQQFDVEGDLLRLTVSGDALALLAWLDQTEQGGAVLQSLTLETRGKLLEARLVLQAF
ncbi:type II secretion system protein GspM [Pseudomonas sp. H11T01]|uniref:type II secretion system protein GspM n=1 Tax=Pseudomonas sp. H11T01 TaxID=3402749 RepID=UPI003ACEDD4F